MAGLSFDDLIPAPKPAAGGLSFDDLIPAKAATPPQDGSLSVENVGRAVARGAPVVGSFLDEADAATNATLAPLIDPILEKVFPGKFQTLPGKSWQERYDQAVAIQRGKDKAFDEANPVTSIAAQLAGGVGGGIGAVKAIPGAATALGVRGGSLPGRLVAGGVSGAGIGAVQGFGAGEGSPEERLADVPRDSAISGALGVAAPALGAAVGRAVAPLAERIRPGAGVDPASRLAEAEAFGIPLTRGQTSGNLIQQGSEEAMRHAARGDAPARIMQGFDANQRQAIDAATGKVQSGLAGRFGTIDSDQVAGEAATAGARREAARYRAEGKANFDAADASGVTVRAEAVQSAKKDIANRLAATDFPFDEKLHPAAWKALGEIDRLVGLPGAPKDAAVLGMSLKGIDQTRRRMMSMKGTNPADMTALSMVRKAFDGWLDDAVDTSLFSGNPEGLDALKAARASWSKYRGMTSPKPGDDAGAAIKKMIGMDVNGQEASNWLYGSSIVSPPGRAVRVAQRLKGVLGADSEEWSAIRQGAWLRAISPAGKQIGPQAIASNIMALTMGKGAPLARTLFTESEISQMQRLARVLQNTVTDPRATNPSKSSYGFARAAKALAIPLAGSLGFSVGGPAGALVGAAAAPAVRSAIARDAAQRAISPSLTQPLFRDPDKVRRLTSGTLAVGNLALTPQIAAR